VDSVPVLPGTGNTKGGSIIILLTSCLTGLDKSVLQIKTKTVSCHTVDSKPVKQEVNRTVILPPLAFPARTVKYHHTLGNSLRRSSNLNLVTSVYFLLALVSIK
jgi:hypothetical protein